MLIDSDFLKYRIYSVVQHSLICISLDGSGAGEVPFSGLGHAMSPGDTALGLAVLCLGDNLLWKGQNYWEKVKTAGKRSKLPDLGTGSHGWDHFSRF